MSKRIAHIFPHRELLTRRESLEGPVNEFLQKCETCGWDIIDIHFVVCDQTGTANAALIVYDVPQECQTAEAQPAPANITSRTTDPSTTQKHSIFRRHEGRG